MTLNDIVLKCLESLKRPGPLGGHVIFTMPKVLRRFPKGELLCVGPNGDRVVMYDAMKITINEVSDDRT